MSLHGDALCNGTDCMQDAFEAIRRARVLLQRPVSFGKGFGNMISHKLCDFEELVRLKWKMSLGRCEKVGDVGCLCRRDVPSIDVLDGMRYNVVDQAGST